MITLHCTCGETFRTDDVHAGKAIRCRCGLLVRIPVPAQVSVPQNQQSRPRPSPNRTSAPPPETRWSRSRTWITFGAAASLIFLFSVLSGPEDIRTGRAPGTLPPSAVSSVSGNEILSVDVVVNDLHDEIDAGYVRLVSATGNGSSSGASVEGYLRNDTDFERLVDINLSRTVYFRNSGAGQNMVAVQVYLDDGGYRTDGRRSFLALSPGVETPVLFIAFCVDFEGDNPTSDESLTVGSVPTDLSPVLARIGEYMTAEPDADVTSAAQVAIWLAQDHKIGWIRSTFEFTPEDETLARSFIQ